METLNEIEEPLNPYSRLFMLFWAITMIIIAGFRADNRQELVSRHKVQVIPAMIKLQVSPNPSKNH